MCTDDLACPDVRIGSGVPADRAKAAAFLKQGAEQPDDAAYVSPARYHWAWPWPKAAASKPIPMPHAPGWNVPRPVVSRKPPSTLARLDATRTTE